MVYNKDYDSELPEGWTIKKLSECVSSEKNAIVDGPFGTQMKIEDYREAGVPVYEMEQLNDLFIISICDCNPSCRYSLVSFVILS